MVVLAIAAAVAVAAAAAARRRRTTTTTRALQGQWRGQLGRSSLSSSRRRIDSNHAFLSLS